jgi:hypothetical protein
MATPKFHPCLKSDKNSEKMNGQKSQWNLYKAEENLLS